MSLCDQILRFQPQNEQEARDREELLRWLDSGVNIYTRGCNTAHLTASGWVVSPDKKQVLLAYHNLYDSWAWLGGHADGETNLQAVAKREVLEESGLTDCRALGDGVFSLEILTVDGHEKHGSYVSSHLHLNVTYLFEADPSAPLRCKPDENKAVAWFPAEQVLEKSTEKWFCERIYSKLMDKVRKLEKTGSTENR